VHRRPQYTRNGGLAILQVNGSFWPGNGQVGRVEAWYAWNCSRSAARLWLVLDRRRRMGEGRASGVPWGEGLGQGDLGRLEGSAMQKDSPNA